MAITDIRTEALEAKPEAKEERALPPLRLGGRLSGSWALGLTAAWLAIFSLGSAVEPAPADPDAMPLLGAVLVSALMVGWIVMAAGFAQRRRYGAAGSLAAAGVLLAMAIACPVSGHHAGIGAWWWFQLAGAVALVAASAAALQTQS